MKPRDWPAIEKANAFKYLVYTPQSNLFDSDYIKKFGMPTSGDSDMDADLANKMTPTYMTILNMASQVEQGAKISFDQPEQTAEIFQIVVEILEEWRAESAKPFSVLEVPEDALARLDGLATAIWPVAQRFMSHDPRATKSSRTIDQIATGRSLNVTRRSVKPDEPAQPKGEYHSIGDAISKNLFERKKRWR